MGRYFGIRIVFSAAAPIALLLAGCASGVSTAACTGADWTALGLADGKSGASDKQSNATIKVCSDAGFVVDAAAYRRAREEGLKHFCTAEGGFAAGRSGQKYEGACLGSDEATFLTSYALGGKLYTLTKAKEEAIREYENAVADLDQHRYLLRVAENRYLKPSISNEDREHERQDADFRLREIDRLEKKLPEMLDAIEMTKTALDAYRIELLSMGLEL